MRLKNALALTVVLLVACSPVLARGFGRVGGFRPSGGFGGASFGRRIGVGGFGGFFGRRATPRPSAPSPVITPPPMRPGVSSFGRTRTDRNISGWVPPARPQAGRTLGTGTTSPTNLGTPPAARPRAGTSTVPGGTGTFGTTRYPRYGTDRPVTYQRGYGGVYVPAGYSPWPFYAWFLFPWLMPHPYPYGSGYAHANPLVSLVATFLAFSILFVMIWLLYRAVKAVLGRGRPIRRYE